ncbi:MAG: hypothetical protein CML22_06690 [Rheinheimera sp.]|nr:hypothetical protein [Rheinheimera sp.]MBM33969.1 hypothetical protein [Rheinheimera sp.]|tara:strand:+ start:3926 stop:4198 length:273 start_codon:yes stop_codon:yes gene_type:complete
MLNRQYALTALSKALFLTNVVLILLAGFALLGFAWTYSELIANNTEGLRDNSVGTLINAGCVLVVTIPLQFLIFKRAFLWQNQESYEKAE